MFGDGLLIDGGDLIVVQPSGLTFVRLNGRADRGRVIERRTDPSLRDPVNDCAGAELLPDRQPGLHDRHPTVHVSGLPRNDDEDEPTSRKPLRLWPGVLAVALQWLVMFGLPIFVPEQGGTAMIGGFVGGLAVLLWWLFFSRAAWSERLGAIVLMVVAVAATSRLVHESIANGMMGFMLFIYAVPVLSLALVAWAATSRGLSSGRRRASMVTAILLACGTLTLVRTNGITGDADSDFEWRWTERRNNGSLRGRRRASRPYPIRQPRSRPRICRLRRPLRTAARLQPAKRTRTALPP